MADNLDDRQVIEKIKIKCFTVKTLHSTSKNSFTWKYFGTLILEKDNKKRSVLIDNVFCSQCIMEAKTKNEEDLLGCCQVKSYSAKVSTGNLARHLKESHKLKETEKAMDQRITTFFGNIRPQCTTSTIQFNDSNRKWLMARDLTLWICRSLLPFDMVDDEAMVDFFLKYKIIIKKEDLPSRTTISRTALDDVYEGMKHHIKDLINNTTPQNVAITTDLWSDAYKRNNYLTLTLHFLNSTLHLENFTLATQIIEGKKTAVKIKEQLQEIIIEYGLEGKKMTMVTDSGANIKKAVFLSNMESHLCLGHGLHNLVVQDGVKNTPEVQKIVTKCKKIVKSLRFKLPDLQKDADEEQKRLLIGVDEAGEVIDMDEQDPFDEESDVIDINNLRVPTIKTATPTRWHSILSMLESIHNPCNRNPIHRLLLKLNKPELIIEDSEWKLLGDLIKLLKKFRDAVNVMSASKASTINVALVFRCEIEEVLKQTDDSEVLIISRMKKNMLDKLEHRFPVTELIIAASLLDCRFQGLWAVDKYLEANGETRVSFLSSFVRKHVRESSVQEARNEPTQSTSLNASTSTSSNLLLAMSQKHSVSSSRSFLEVAPIEAECWKYFGGCDAKDLSDGNVLGYWQEKKNSYPWLFNCARSILGIPATSTPSERVFSVAGLTITAKRSRLSPTSVDKIIFIHDNYNICKRQVQK